MGFSPVTRHLLLPALVPAIFFLNAFTPKEVLGCRTRGLVALGIALLSVVAAVAASMLGLRRRLGGDPEGARWWSLTTVVLLVPLVALLWLA